MKYLYTLVLFIISINQLTAQVYVEKQTRHRFAQMHLGLDLQTSFGGNSYFNNSQGDVENIDLEPLTSTRFLIGGTHFWGHADIYVAIPIYTQKMSTENLDINYSLGVETVFKYYPWRIENNKIRPFLGLSLAPFSFQQTNRNLDYPEGSFLNKTKIPISTGFTFNNKNHLLEVGLTYNYNHIENYYINQLTAYRITTPPIFATLSYKYMFDTTIGAEKNWENGRTKKITEKLAKDGRLNGFYIGAGMSSAWFLGNSTHNEQNRPFITNIGNSVMPEFTTGYYWHKPDITLGMAYRGYGKEITAYEYSQSFGRQSLALEATKTLGDYHGFVPFIGPVVSYENLTFTEYRKGNIEINKSQNQINYGLIFGWDIRPNRIAWFTLRTNLRYFPNLKLDLDNKQSINFNNIEFNFIQMIVYPGRL